MPDTHLPFRPRRYARPVDIRSFLIVLIDGLGLRPGLVHRVELFPVLLRPVPREPQAVDQRAHSSVRVQGHTAELTQAPRNEQRSVVVTDRDELRATELDVQADFEHLVMDLTEGPESRQIAHMDAVGRSGIEHLVLAIASTPDEAMDDRYRPISDVDTSFRRPSDVQVSDRAADLI